MTRLLLCLFCLSLAGCASTPHSDGANASVGARLADMPHWMGGLPADAPPRRGTPEYDAWMAQRAKEAARPKSGDTKSGDTKDGSKNVKKDAAGAVAR
ncbi:hypothetical protein [Bradyrhizobium liaoningense]|uniref:hypothetical protein n=1 Tax=Bradyrhizobium liaoningense TaxID=43992 RepID=UPI001BA8E59E|nr:hypothetical protein [Bradyrhizobium liaoningense]MBR0716018.1 hypothetical protein [Bradyrhizobium liaoningense]